MLTIRSLADINRMTPFFKKRARVLIGGGGYIRPEAASVAAKSGPKITLVEVADRILERVAAPQTSGYFRALDRSYGMEITEGVDLSKLQGDERVQSAQLSGGTVLDVDFVIVGTVLSLIGISMNRNF
ncbi:FAD-dependent oxidoreductase [Neptunicoccus cionae]|uniref:FAD/NAD(P)-binding domain-containing protein n=1 Tax=Neptunicoccus cionae TaxID=2035344 RepID=A0A916VS58_9RHOB|nr:hypothetical protein GCM10011498_27670 [Amylibacter cionae]